MKTIQSRAKTTGKAVFLCAAIALLGWYVRYMHRSANPQQAQAQDDSVIDLQQAPEVIEFEGFINYGQPIQTTGVNALEQPTTVILSSKSISQPVFSTRKLKVQPLVHPDPVVFDGSKSPGRPVLRALDFSDAWRWNGTDAKPKEN